jgi:hypothetical protein
METYKFKQLIGFLKQKDVQFENGLTDEEIHKVQNTFCIRFPTDLKLFLQLALPVSDGFVNWRDSLISNDSKQKTLHKLDWPLRGILYDVSNNGFWMDSWGDMPGSYPEKEEIVKRNFISYPKLVPIYSHRYIPSEPVEFNNPIFSVYQTDVIYYGFNILDYFAKEFHFDLPANFNVPNAPMREIAPIRAIVFWSDLVEL